MLDRLVRAAAEAADLEFMCLGLRVGDQYEYIATHGFPFHAFADWVPNGRMKASLFNREVEVANLSKETNFAALGSVPIARTWRFGANVPIKLQTKLVDDGVLALSGADRHERECDGTTLAPMRRFAELITDSIWLMQQIHLASYSRDNVGGALRIATDVLHQTFTPVALLNEELELFDFSPGFTQLQRKLMGNTPAVGQSVADIWLDQQAQKFVRSSFENEHSILDASTKPASGNDRLKFDFHVLRFLEVDMRVGVFGVHQNRVDIEYWNDVLSGPHSVNIPKAPSEGEGPLSRFLDETLIRKSRLLQRNGVGYLGVRSWRKPIKSHQISALRALKSEPPEAFVQMIAKEMAEAITSLHGANAARAVVPVPCGHSGPGCLAERIAYALANLMGIKPIRAFECLPSAGSSHPKSNLKRPKMKLIEPPECPLILVDDVATSGVHIEEAAQLLRKAAPIVLPVAWIAD